MSDTPRVSALAAELAERDAQLTETVRDRDRLQAENAALREALQLAAVINPYGSVENAKARDAASAPSRSANEYGADEASNCAETIRIRRGQTGFGVS